LTDTAGTITDTYFYTAFGEELAKTGTTENEFRYVGEQWDPNLNSYYLRHRYLNPSNGTFFSCDPLYGYYSNIVLGGYLYANCSPVNGHDPTGMFTLVEMMTTTSLASTLESINFDHSMALLNAGMKILSRGEDEEFAASIEKVQIGLETAQMLIGGVTITHIGVNGAKAVYNLVEAIATGLVKSKAWKKVFDLKGAAKTGAYLTEEEMKHLNQVAQKYKTQIAVVGSRARGAGRNIFTEAPVGKKAWEKSDIDVMIDKEVDISTRGNFTNDLKSYGSSNDHVSIMFQDVSAAKPPMIIIDGR
jgi:RHS repeat-associated protein